MITGYAMSAHPQHLPISTMIHTVFGYTLMAAGAVRLAEISFVLRDRSTSSSDPFEPSSFQYLTPFVSVLPLVRSEKYCGQILTEIQLLCASGFLFMGATEEQMQLLNDAGVTHVSYVLILYSCAFVMFLCKSISCPMNCPPLPS
jgi:hypothetical protein